MAGGRTRSQQALTIPLSGARSLRVLREAQADAPGFRFEGIARQAFRLAGGYREGTVCSVLKSERAQLQGHDEP